jgi:hypothetical protein
VTPKKRFMGLFDYDLDPCATEGLKKINTRIMSGFKVIKISKTNNKARVKVLYKLKGIFVLSCVPVPNIQFISYNDWKGIAIFDLVKTNNMWKIDTLSIDIQPPLPKSEDWAFNKIEKLIKYQKNNIDFDNKAKECIDAIKEGKSCLIQRWDKVRQEINKRGTSNE